MDTQGKRRRNKTFTREIFITEVAAKFLPQMVQYIE
jgi:hypothetical protein